MYLGFGMCRAIALELGLALLCSRLVAGVYRREAKVLVALQECYIANKCVELSVGAVEEIGNHGPKGLLVTLEGETSKCSVPQQELVFQENQAHYQPHTIRFWMPVLLALARRNSKRKVRRRHLSQKQNRT
jgi:hypothetical protein